jgi:co-chaperonin GroES (HSP10)
VKIDLERFGAAKDIKAELIAATAKAVPRTRLLRNRVLVASFVASERTAGGIIRPQKTMDEDRFQGKVGLVLKMGPIAFKFDEDPEGELAPAIHDWVLYRPADSHEIGLGEGAPCRMIYDDLVQAIVENPMDYY